MLDGIDDREYEVAGSESHVEYRNLEEIHPSRERVVLSSGFQLHDIRQQYVFVSCVTLATQALANANSFVGLGTKSFFGFVFSFSKWFFSLIICSFGYDVVIRVQ